MHKSTDQDRSIVEIYLQRKQDRHLFQLHWSSIAVQQAVTNQ